MRKQLKKTTPKKGSKKRWKKYEKTFKKWSKKEVKIKKKPSKKRCEKNIRKTDIPAHHPGAALSPTNTTKVNKKHTNLPHKPNNERRRWVWRRCVKKGECKKVTSKDQLQPSTTPRAPSGPERIYTSISLPRESEPLFFQGTFCFLQETGHK